MLCIKLWGHPSPEKFNKSPSGNVFLVMNLTVVIVAIYELELRTPFD